MTIKSKGVMISITVVVTLTLTTAATIYGLANLVLAQGAPTITYGLSGSEAVPPVQTDATGVIEITPMGADSIAYSVNATNIEGVTAGHIHLGKQGENGPVVVTLFNYDSPMNGVSESGTITADKLEGPMSGMQISDLGAAGANSTVYYNIHTEQNPEGEIRGQSGAPTN
ncbi:MAG TPA: CHRD domain-containing protein [Nitrososphaeraceae archaeon]|nr:CHRD domain-containing protein [Nitrososphaeraceae archaeon]